MLYLEFLILTMMTENTIFRFKFTNEFTEHLLSFAKLHQYDDRVTYKEEWSRWVQNNDAFIQDESNRMKTLGYDGNVLEKMYKSGRYYFRTKTKNQPKTRRKYISIDKDVIEAMDNHILQHFGTPVFKPSSSHDDFCNEYTDTIQEEYTRLLSEELTKNEISNKIKKTYKNRYFLFSKHKNANVDITRRDDDNSIKEDSIKED